MKKILTEIEKELNKAQKAFHNAFNTIENMREKDYKSLSIFDIELFNDASKSYNKNNRLINKLSEAKRNIESAIETLNED